MDRQNMKKIWQKFKKPLCSKDEQVLMDLELGE